MSNTFADAPALAPAAREAAPIDRGLISLSNSISDLRDEVSALIHDIDPILAREFATAGEKAPTDEEISPHSTVANAVFSMRENLVALTQELNMVRHRVEL